MSIIFLKIKLFFELFRDTGEFRFLLSAIISIVFVLMFVAGIVFLVVALTHIAKRIVGGKK